jgi:hypothetical protein
MLPDMPIMPELATPLRTVMNGTLMMRRHIISGSIVSIPRPTHALKYLEAFPRYLCWTWWRFTLLIHLRLAFTSYWSRIS